MNSNSDQPGNSGYQELAEKIADLEQWVAQLESGGKPIYVPKNEEEDLEISFKIKGTDDIEYESNIGEYGLAWLGNIVLFFGIAFLVEYLRTSGFNFISSSLGFSAVAGIFVLAHYLSFRIKLSLS
jgi:uncharacterized membrane protein